MWYTIFHVYQWLQEHVRIVAVDDNFDGIVSIEIGRWNIRRLPGLIGMYQLPIFDVISCVKIKLYVGVWAFFVQNPSAGAQWNVAVASLAGLLTGGHIYRCCSRWNKECCRCTRMWYNNFVLLFYWLRLKVRNSQVRRAYESVNDSCYFECKVTHRTQKGPSG